jgi:L-malate glycosyltransferase
MRVLFVSDYLHPNYHRLVELLADVPDLDILLVNLAGFGQATGCYPSANGQRAYIVQALPFLGASDDPHRRFFWPPRFHIRQFKPELIHSMFEQESLGALEVILAHWLSASRAPLILYSNQNILRQRSWAVRLLSRLTMQAAQHVLCASNEAISVLRQQGYQGGCSVMPPVGVDTRSFYPKPVPDLRRQLGVSGLVVGYVGRLVSDKGVDTLLQAVAQVNLPMHLVIVGSGPQQTYFHALSQELHIANSCHFVNSVSYDDIANYMNLFDILVVPSQTRPNWKEQFGRVLIEAMACKIPIIGSNSGAIPEVIGDAGLIFPEGDSTALVGCLEQLLISPDLRCDLAERGYHRVLAHYTQEHIARQTAEFYHQIIAEKLTEDKTT